MQIYYLYIKGGLYNCKAGSYRPISLVSPLVKILHGVITIE